MDARKRGDVPALLDALRHPHLRTAAIHRLCELRATEAIPKIVPLLSAPSPVLRRSAAHALGRLQAREATARLIEVARSDSDSAARSWALFALGCIGLEAPDSRVLQLAADPIDIVRHAAIAALLASNHDNTAAQGARLRAAHGWRQRRGIDRVVMRIAAERETTG